MTAHICYSFHFKNSGKWPWLEIGFRVCILPNKLASKTSDAAALISASSIGALAGRYRFIDSSLRPCFNYSSYFWHLKSVSLSEIHMFWPMYTVHRNLHVLFFCVSFICCEKLILLCFTCIPSFIYQLCSFVCDKLHLHNEYVWGA